MGTVPYGKDEKIIMKSLLGATKIYEKVRKVGIFRMNGAADSEGKGHPHHPFTNILSFIAP